MHRRHDGDLFAFLQRITAIDKLYSYADQNTFVVRPKGRLLRIDFVQQIANSRSFRQIDVLLTDSGQISQLRVKLYSHFHPLKSAIKPDVISSNMQVIRPIS